MAYKYLVDLTETEQTYLLKLIQKGKPSARKVARAQVLLHAAEGATDDEIAQALHVGVSTVHRTRQRFVDEASVAWMKRSLGSVIQVLGPHPRIPAFGLLPGYHSNSSLGRACLCPTCTAMNTIGLFLSNMTTLLDGT